MKPIQIEEINPDKLDEIAWQWEEQHIENLLRQNVMNLGDEYRRSREYASEIETKCRIRAMRLYYQFKFSKKEIAELFGVEVRVVTRWLKSDR